MRVKNYGEALPLYASLTQQFPYGALLFEFGSAAVGSGDFELGHRIWQTLLNREPDNASLLWPLAEEYGKLSMFSKANAIYAKATALEPQNLEMQLRMVSYFARTGATEEGRAAVEKCLEIDSKNPWARFLTVHLDRLDKKYDGVEAELRKLLAEAPPIPQLLSGCHLELAFVLDNEERYDEAMQHLVESKKIAALQMPAAAEQKATDEVRLQGLHATKALPRNILTLWAKSFPPPVRAPMPPLAFLCGHIRSGTTLLERIFDAHPLIAAFDELLAFQTIVPLVDIGALELPAQTLNFFRTRYLKNLTVEAGVPDGKTLFDKNPAATAALPALLRTFPEMRVLIALRDPRDIMISSFFMKPLHYIHLSLESMARHYSASMDAWLAVRQWEGLNWMQTRYEDVVTNLEHEGRRATQFLGLEWHENQARFYENNRGKSVKNYSEVTKPIYTKAMGRWRAYEKYLAPVLPVLEPYCKEFGYD